MKRKGDDYSIVPSKRTRNEISVVGTREKAVVTSAVSKLFLALFTKPNYFSSRYR